VAAPDDGIDMSLRNAGSFPTDIIIIIIIIIIKAVDPAQSY
jgi:hypothetical protein